jgi:hypothetical protein
MWDAIGFKAFPRLCALAEMGWTPKDLRSYPEFADRLGVDLVRLKNAGVPFRVPPPDAVVRNGRIEILPPFASATIQYTVDGSDPFNSPSAVRWDGKSIEGEAPQFRARTVVSGRFSPLHVGARSEAFAAVTTTIPCYGEDHAPSRMADKDPRTYFWSNRPVSKGEFVTVTFKEPLTLTHIESVSGMPGEPGRDALAQGELAISEDGATFRKVADFASGSANADLPQKTPVKAVRITVTADQEKWLILQDLVLR